MDCSETSRSTLPLHASMIIGDTGKITMNKMHTSSAEIGDSRGPNPIGEERMMMTPTYRLKRGAAETREINLASSTFLPEISKYSSANFNVVQ